MASILRFKSSAWPFQTANHQEQTLPGFGGRSPAQSLQEFLGPPCWAFPESWGWRVGSAPGEEAQVFQESAGPGRSAITLRVGPKSTPAFEQRLEEWARQNGEHVEWQRP